MEVLLEGDVRASRAFVLLKELGYALTLLAFTPLPNDVPLVPAGTMLF